MKINPLLVALVFSCPLFAGCSRERDSSGPGVSGFVRDTRTMVVSDGGDPVTNHLARTELLGLCREWGVDRVLLDVGTYLDNQYNTNYTVRLAGLVSEAHKQNLEIYATGVQHPTPELAEPANHYRAWIQVVEFLKFHRDRPPEQCFDGYVESIDPTLLATWTNAPEKAAADFQSLVWAYRLAFMEHAPNLPLGWVVDASLDKHPWSTGIYTHVDFVFVKGVGDDPETASAAISGELALNAPLGKKVVTLVDTRDLALLGLGKSSQTLYEEGWGGLASLEKRLSKAAGGGRVYGGIVLNDYAGLKKWPPPPKR